MEFQPGLTDPSRGVRVMSSGSSGPSSSAASSSSGSGDSQIKRCADCRATTTPLWRAGPSGPKSLCNACGIRYRKSRRAVPVSKEAVMKPKREIDGGSGGERFKVSFKLRMLGPGLCKPRSMAQKQRRRRSMLGEVEEAAVLLMALSSGFLHA
ncbi:hypothetical protein OPV22_012300 [Ensete ventricosum]|uniref:GATA-type domain-containing protein n=1 Tax=Ensete ventricosum TaxID=4639 RepID=A0AAV8PKU0_ENSVE|nr:hypothetical protein OPV22_012300 [Ensete ventricosum]